MKMSPTLRSELTGRLLIGALQEQDAALAAEAASTRAQFLARVSRDLALSLDEETTRETMRRVALPRRGAWTIVDLVESDGFIHRLPVVHPDPEKRELAQQLEKLWPSDRTVTPPPRSPTPQPMILSQLSGATLLNATHGEESLQLLREIGFEYLLVVPLIVRAHVLGALLFVSQRGDPEFTTDEIALAVDVAARCALALENARLYQEADMLRVAAQQANQSKSQFLRSMSHELRTPLNAIGGFAELMALGIQGPVTEEQRQSLERIRVNQQHLLGMITEVLSFAQLETGRMEFHFSRVPLRGALAGVVDMLSLAISAAQLKVVGPEGDANTVAWADPDRVRQILLNLVTNAIKYGRGPNGTITLRCGHSGDVVTASVADSGPGIAPEKLASIFEPFVQLASGVNDRHEGVGLGLAISRDLARGMQGDLAVESTLGKGTRFTLTLPRAQKP
jgi:signal transduction histidine kinase